MDLPGFFLPELKSSTESLKILLVDDEPNTLQLVRKILQADGHDIYEAVDGVQAIEMFDNVEPDLILLDVVIPRMDGLAVLREIRRRDKIVGIIMVSALTSEELAVKSMLTGADDYVGKPFKLKTIRMNIRRVMDKVRLRQHNAILQQEIDAANAKLREIFKLYMAPSLAEKLLSNPVLPKLGGERQHVTVLFMDFCDYTPLAHELPPDKVIRILNEYLALVATSVPENGGYLDKIMGDGFMALFHAADQPNHATNAVHCAVQMHRTVADWNPTQMHPLQLRIGIHTGEAVVGNIGTQEMMNYTAIGDSVNLAKRLEESGRASEILVSADTYELLERDELYSAQIELSCVGSQLFKGRHTPIDVYRVTDCAPSASD